MCYNVIANDGDEGENMASQELGKVATTARVVDQVLSVVYHNTEVVRVDATSITLNSGGYKTATTKTRMNQAANQFDLGYQVNQERGVWFVRHRGNVIPFDGDEITIPR